MNPNHPVVAASVRSVVEPLESRRMLSASLSGGVLEVAGTRRADHITLTRTSTGRVDVSVNGVHASFRGRSVKSIHVNAGRGADAVGVSNENGGIVAPRSIDGGDGDDTLVGGKGVDSIQGQGGDDALDGRQGNDVADGGAGDDSVFGGAGDDTLHGGEDDDSLRGGDGDDDQFGDAGNDSLAGDAGNDFAFGDAGDDSVVGGAGDDDVDGGEGTDDVEGGAGQNTFHGDHDDKFERKDDPAGDDNGGDGTGGGGEGTDDGTGEEDPLILQTLSQFAAAGKFAK